MVRWCSATMLVLLAADSLTCAEPTQVPLDGRGGGVLAYCYQPLSGPALKEIWGINADGSGNVRLVAGDIGFNYPDWSPDGQYLAMAGYVSGQTQSIYVAAVGSPGPNRLTSDPGVLDGDPVWSPNGIMVAFTRTYPDQNNRTEIWVTEADSGIPRWTGLLGMAARWSPDGTHFVYASGPTTDADIMIARVDGTEAAHLTSSAAAEYQPMWSPDGARIAYVSNADGDDDIYVMNADGSDPTRITDNTVGDYSPRWSPDGSWIAFESELSGSGHWELYLIRPDGTGLRRVTNTPANASAINPAWNPVP
jgi:Tol biopolymer transport system component